MSVIVKGMDMPDSCAVCRFAGRGGYFMERIVCMFTGENEDAENVDRLPDCPLVALPDHHGDLIDRDEFKETLDYYIREAGWSDEHNEALTWVKDDFIDAEMIIVEAEGEP